MKFIKNPEPVTAIMWDGTNEGDITSFTGHNRPIGLAIPGIPGVIIIAGATLSPGDWLIKDSNGDYSSCDPTKFKMTYTPC